MLVPTHIYCLNILYSGVVICNFLQLRVINNGKPRYGAIRQTLRWCKCACRYWIISHLKPPRCCILTSIYCTILYRYFSRSDFYQYEKYYGQVRLAGRYPVLWHFLLIRKSGLNLDRQPKQQLTCNTTLWVMNDNFKEKDLTLTALYKDKVLYLQHVYPTMEYCS